MVDYLTAAEGSLADFPALSSLRSSLSVLRVLLYLEDWRNSCRGNQILRIIANFKIPHTCESQTSTRSATSAFIAPLLPKDNNKILIGNQIGISHHHQPIFLNPKVVSASMTSRRRRTSMEVSAHDGDFKAVMAMIESVRVAFTPHS